MENIENHPAWIEIDLTAFRSNIAAIRRKIGSKQLCCVVKANGYGHGLIPIAKAALDAGVDSFGVAHLQEAIHLRNAGIKLPILVFGAIHEHQIEDLIRYQVEFTISSSYKAKLVASIAKRLSAVCTVHLEIDTGMRRTGVRIESSLPLIDYLVSEPCFYLKGIYSHFVMSETPGNEYTLRQIEQFHRLKNRVGGSFIWHIANSGAVTHYPDSYFDMVRPGLLCYGVGSDSTEIVPILSLKAKISYFKVVEAGKGISYGHTYQTESKTRIVTIPVGYGDGYRRDFSNRFGVLIRGKRYPIAGTVCMDQFMVDLGQNEAYVGEEVVLIGRQGNEKIDLPEMATLSGTDPREILCHFNNRIPRVYIDTLKLNKQNSCSESDGRAWDAQKL